MTASTARYDVAVIGLGAMGAATLYQLAKRGVRAIGLDAFNPPHSLGSSHGETRITRAAVGEGAAYVPLVLASHRIWRELEDVTGETLFVASGLVVLGQPSLGTIVHGGGDFVGTTARIAAENGIEHEMLDAGAIATRFPVFQPQPDTRAYFEPGSGYVIPEACVRAQLSEALRLGAELRPHTHVVSLDDSGPGVAINTAEGSVKADRCVLAAGGWTSALAGTPFDRLLEVQRQAFHWFKLDPDFPLAAQMPAFIWLHGTGEEGQFYGFPSLPGGNTLKVATERYGAPAEMAQLDRIVSRTESAAMFDVHVAGRLRGVNAAVERTVVCAYTVTPDFGFIIDQHPSMPRVLVISACSGHGFKHSAGIGEAVAALLAEGRSTCDLAPFGLARFS